MHPIISKQMAALRPDTTQRCLHAATSICLLPCLALRDQLQRMHRPLGCAVTTLPMYLNSHDLAYSVTCSANISTGRQNPWHDEPLLCCCLLPKLDKKDEHPSQDADGLALGLDICCWHGNLLGITPYVHHKSLLQRRLDKQPIRRASLHYAHISSFAL